MLVALQPCHQILPTLQQSHNATIACTKKYCPCCTIILVRCLDAHAESVAAGAWMHTQSQLLHKDVLLL